MGFKVAPLGRSSELNVIGLPLASLAGIVKLSESPSSTTRVRSVPNWGDDHARDRDLEALEGRGDAVGGVIRTLE